MVTRCYKGLQGVTRDYTGLQGVTRNKRGDRGDNGLQGVTKDYRNFFLTRTLPHTFSLCILNTNQSWRKSQIFFQNDGITPLENF